MSKIKKQKLNKHGIKLSASKQHIKINKAFKTIKEILYKNKYGGGNISKNTDYSPQIFHFNENEQDLTKMNKELSPLSGSEPPYEPSKWNNNENIKKNHNCYAYALNEIVPSRADKPQPGYFSGYQQMKDADYKCENFYNRLKKDVPSLYLTNFDKPCKQGHHKAFIALDTNQADTDYHFYRQDDNQLWSHKPGRREAVNVDASGKKIKNPVKANRKYEYFNYSTPCFFFCINPLLAKSSSKAANK